MDNFFTLLSFGENSADIENLVSSLTCSSYGENLVFSDSPTLNIGSDYSLYLNYFTAPAKNTLKPDEHKAQPCASNQNAPMIVANTRIDNMPELMPLLAPLFDTNASPLPSVQQQLIQELYAKYKSQCAEKLQGSFHFALWDEGSQSVYAAIDAFSSRSLFYLVVDNVCIVSSDAKLLAQYPNFKLTLNEHAVAQWLAGRPSPAVSMFEQIKRLPNGHHLTYSVTGGLVIKRFWDISTDKNIVYKNDDEYCQHFSELLHNNVANSCVDQGIKSTEALPVFCQMSGGMDSTSITAIAKKVTDNRAVSLHTISHTYKNTKSCDESDKINEMIVHLNISDSHFIELDQFDSISFNELYPTDFDSPGIVYSPKYQQEIALINSHSSKTLLTGNGGDETCWGHSASYRTRLLKGDLGVIPEVAFACKTLEQPVFKSLYQVFISPFIPEKLMKLQKLICGKPFVQGEHSPWLTPKAITLINSVKTENPYSSDEPAKMARYHSIHNTSTYNAMRSYQKIAGEFDINVYHPFFSPDIVNFSFAIPENQLIRGAYPKWLLRKTMEGDLPDSVCWNKQKVVFDLHFANLVRSNQVELRSLLSHNGLEALGLINNIKLLQAFDEVVKNKAQHLTVDLLYAILTQLWFQTQFINK